MILEQTYKVESDQPVFAGHFPGNPVLPGVMLLSFIKKVLQAHFGGEVSLARIDKQRFVRPVVPDCELAVSCRILDNRDGLLAADCTASVEGVTVVKVRATFRCSAADGKAAAAYG